MIVSSKMFIPIVYREYTSNVSEMFKLYRQYIKEYVKYIV